jgi:hypothetical protein
MSKIKIYRQTVAVHNIDLVEKKDLDNALHDIVLLKIALGNIWREAMISIRDGRPANAQWIMDQTINITGNIDEFEY